MKNNMNKKLLKTVMLATVLTTALSACKSTNNGANNTMIKTTEPLTLKRIYQDHEFKSERIGRIRWLQDGSAYMAVEPSKAKKKDKEGKEVNVGKDILEYDPETLSSKVLVSAAQLTPQNSDKPLKIDDYTFSPNRQKVLIYTNSKKVWRSNSRGDYWLLNLQTNELTQLGAGLTKGKQANSQLMFAKFSPDASKVGFVYHNNIYVQRLSDYKISQLTNDAGKGIINGAFDWVYEEEFLIKDGFRWSPDGEKIAYWQLDTSGSKDFTLINNTDALYPTITKFPYPKVGEENALASIGVVSLATQKTVWIKLPNNSRNMYIPRMNWTGNSEQILVQHLNRKQDTDILYLADVKNGNVNVMMTEQEPNFLDAIEDARWLNNGKSFIWTSERSGWRHLYNISRDGKTVTDLTPGDFDITDFKAIDEQSGWLYYMAAPKHVEQRYLFRSKLDASIVNQRVTPEKYKGFNRYYMAENGQWAIHSHSSFDTPTTKYLVKIEGHQAKHTLMTNEKLKDKLAKINRAKTEFFQVTAQDGVVLDGYITRPADFEPSKKYPIIFYVYGEAWGQTVQDKWRGNAYMWDQMLTQQGFIVASIDNRGTRAPKGQNWRKSIYGAVGVLSSRDQSDALKSMAKRWSYIDTKHVGIWGHSGGGSMTLNMLFRYPEQYQVGISLAPVADQLLYDTIYQERYSGLLPDYADGYKEGSPITHAKNLQGKLLLMHGTGDDNVHYQGSERLINELIKHNKQFDFMSFPNRTHGMREGKGTTLFIKTKMTNYFEQYLKK